MLIQRASQPFFTTTDSITTTTLTIMAQVGTTGSGMAARMPTGFGAAVTLIGGSATKKVKK